MANFIYEFEGVRGRNLKLYDTKVVITTNVTMGSLLTGNVTDGEKTIFLCDIVGIQFKKSGALIGYLQFETPSMQMNNTGDNMFSENTFTYTDGTNGITNKMMTALYNFVVERVEEIKYRSTLVCPIPDFESMKEYSDSVEQAQYMAAKSEALRQEEKARKEQERKEKEAKEEQERREKEAEWAVYWETHAEEKAQLEEEKRNLKEEISILTKKHSSHPGEKRRWELDQEISALRDQQAALGSFKKAEKMAIDEQINKLKEEHDRIYAQTVAEKSALWGEIEEKKSRLAEIEQKLPSNDETQKKAWWL